MNRRPHGSDARRYLSWGVLLGAGLGAVALAYSLRSVFNPLLLGLLLAYVLNPVVEVLERRGISRTVAVTGLFAGVLLTLVLVISFATLEAAHQLLALRDQLSGERLLDPEDPDDRKLIDAYLKVAKADRARPALPTAERGPSLLPGAELHHARVTQVGEAFFLDRNGDDERQAGLIERATDLAAAQLGRVKVGRAELLRFARRVEDHASQLTRYGAQVSQGVKKSFDKLGTFVSYMFLVPLYTFFLLMGFSDLRASIRAHLPADYRERIVTITTRIDGQVAAFFRGKLMLCALKGLVTALGLWLCGVPFALFLGLGAGVLSVVPFIGPLVTLPLAAFLAYGVGDPFAVRLIGVCVAFGAAEVVEGVAQPVILGKEVGINPLLLILSFFVFGELLGFFGVLLAVPIASVCKTLFEELILPEIKALAAVGGAAPVEPGGEHAPSVPTFGSSSSET